MFFKSAAKVILFFQITKFFSKKMQKKLFYLTTHVCFERVPIKFHATLTRQRTHVFHVIDTIFVFTEYKPCYIMPTYIPKHVTIILNTKSSIRFAQIVTCAFTYRKFCTELVAILIWFTIQYFICHSLALFL